MPNTGTVYHAGVEAPASGTRSKYLPLPCTIALSLPAWNAPTGQMPFVIVPDESVYVDQQTLKLQVCLCFGRTFVQLDKLGGNAGLKPWSGVGVCVVLVILGDVYARPARILSRRLKC